LFCQRNSTSTANNAPSLKNRLSADYNGADQSSTSGRGQANLGTGMGAPARFVYPYSRHQQKEEPCIFRYESLRLFASEGKIGV